MYLANGGACMRSAKLRNFDSAPPSLMASPRTIEAVLNVFQHGFHVLSRCAAAVDQELSFGGVSIMAQAFQGPNHAHWTASIVRPTKTSEKSRELIRCI